MINKFIGSHITFFFLPHIFFNLFIFLSYSKFFFFFFPTSTWIGAFIQTRSQSAIRVLFTLHYLCGPIGPAVFFLFHGLLVPSFWFLGVFFGFFLIFRGEVKKTKLNS